MKAKLLLLALGMFLGAGSAFATIYTVSNNTNSPGQYTTFAAAQAVATNGDTVYMHGSPFNYGTLNFTKQLVVIGTGHNPQKQSPLVSFCDYVQFSTGSNGSKVIGMQIYQFSSNSDNVDNIGLYSCKITYRGYIPNYYCDNWMIDGCVFVYTAQCFSGGCYGSGFTFRNCFIGGALENFGNCQNGYHYIDHCIFTRPSGDVFSNDYAFYVNNSIFYHINVPGNGMSATWANNLSYACNNNNFPGGTNQVNVDPQFVNVPNTTVSWSYSYNFALQTASAGHNAGTDGTDLGLYGGFGDFDRDGTPRIPYIKQFDINGSNAVAPGGNLNVTIKSNIR